jgi:hypothetical protein
MKDIGPVVFGYKPPISWEKGSQDSRIPVFVSQGFDHRFEHSLDFTGLPS